MSPRFESLPPVAMVALLASCAGGREPSHSAASAPPAAVTVTATDYAFQAPDTIDAGITAFQLVNGGEQLHMGQLIRLDGGRTLDEFLVAYEEAFRTSGPRPTWAVRLGGPGAAEPHGRSNATHELEPGSYAWICLMNVPDGIPHVVKARMARAFTVRDRGPEAPRQVAPEADVVIRLTDYTFALSGPLTAGRHVIRVENAGAEPHEVALVRLAPGRTLQDLEAWLQAPQGAPPVSPSGGVSSLVTGAVAWFEATLTAGEYVLLCFVTAPDGRPHTAHGMIHHVRIH